MSASEIGTLLFGSVGFKYNVFKEGLWTFGSCWEDEDGYSTIKGFML